MKLLLFIVMLSPFISQAEDAKPVAGRNAVVSPVVAAVNGENLLKSELDEAIQKDGDVNSRQVVLDRLIQAKIISQEIAKTDIPERPEVVKAVSEYAQDLYIDTWAKEAMSSIPVNEDEVGAEYELYIEEVAEKQYSASYLLVKTRAEADDLILKLSSDDPKSFEELAKSSDVKTDDLGWFGLRSISLEVGNAIETLKKGELYESPVETTFGYYVIRLDDVRYQRDHVPALKNVKGFLEGRVRAKKFPNYIKKLKSEARVEIK